MVKNTIKHNGFTLMERMIVIAIIAILATVAYPSYTQYMIRTNRVDTQSEMMQISQRLQSYYVIHHNYTHAKLDNNAISKDYPASGSVYTIRLSSNDQTWILTAEPKLNSVQSSDGNLVLNHQGQKCWTKGSTCTPSATTNWDGR
ncbi:type IV pilin protein [Acinetobacter nematophilus]|uniref:type IV pilin protein n=1 Tax=Acinetobacter nematophilus TaxID=2994642 RepID=UPI003AF6D382